MIQSHTVTSVADAQPLSALKNWAAVRGLKGIQLLGVTGTVFYGGNNAQPLSVPTVSPSDVLPVVHLNDLYLKGAGTVTVVCFL